MGGECEVSLLGSGDAAAEHRLWVSESMSTSSGSQLDVAGCFNTVVESEWRTLSVNPILMLPIVDAAEFLKLPIVDERCGWVELE